MEGTHDFVFSPLPPSFECPSQCGAEPGAYLSVEVGIVSVCFFQFHLSPFHPLIISCVAAVDDLFDGTIPTGNAFDDEDAASAEVVSLEGARSNSFESSFLAEISLTSCMEISFDSLILKALLLMIKKQRKKSVTTLRV